MVVSGSVARLRTDGEAEPTCELSAPTAAALAGLLGGETALEADAHHHGIVVTGDAEWLSAALGTVLSSA